MMNRHVCVITSEDYIDTDVAYLLGMLFGRGQLIEQENVRRLVITLDIRQTLPKLPPNVTLDMDLALENERALNQVRRRINELLDANVDVTPVSKGKATLTATFVKRTIAWRDLKCLCSDGSERSNFKLPKEFFSFPRILHEEFLRGFADVAVTPSFADNAWGGRARVAFPVVNQNKAFARQLVKLLNQCGIKAKQLSGSEKKRGSRKEHRVRPYAEDYECIGFSFDHKQRLLEVLADYNRSLGKSGKKKRRRKTS